ncbi:DUF4194 domain-containing protein [Heliobacterium undosum]|uniref:DUF4194 domain-containing protein n=1 Tax=Heliomicrobium undosum TaxID=121734 RepID=A0A845LAE0_9FIRM|nr:DUF4194 domain-containing protein [Heliomicrobium undosum]
MFENLGEQDRERLRDVINRLMAVNFLLKELERERYALARRLRPQLEEFFKFLGWEITFDERHECIAVASPEGFHRRPLSREESIWLLVLRLIYQEKRQSLTLSDYPMTNLNEIRAKYETFRLPLFTKSRLVDLVRLGVHYKLMDALDEDVRADNCRFRLFHSLQHAIDGEVLETLHGKIMRYEISGEEGMFDEVAETPALD